MHKLRLKLPAKTGRPNQIVPTTPVTVTIDEAGMYNTVSIDRATRVSSGADVTDVSQESCVPKSFVSLPHTSRAPKDEPDKAQYSVERIIRQIGTDGNIQCVVLLVRVPAM